MNQSLSGPNNPAAVLAALLIDRALCDRQGIERAPRKGETLFDQGQQLDRVFLLKTGLVKLVYATPDGDEWIKSLIVDTGLFGPSGSSDTGLISYSAMALEPSSVLALPLPWVAASLAADASLNRAYAKFIDWVRQRKEVREAALLCRTAEQRYIDLLTNEPYLMARLQQADIARYLRITPIAFSRIKRRISGRRISPEN